MTNNDILRRIRYALNLNDKQVAHMFALAGVTIPPESVGALMAHDDEHWAVICTDERLTEVLDGLIIDRRGPPKEGINKPLPPQNMTNNDILKKLRIALTLRDSDILEILGAGGQTMSKSELSALFRRPEHRHHRECGDQVLRKFLYGLTLRLRPKGDNPA